jgi:hypothetical protein
MKTASLQEIKQRLQHASPAELTEYCLRLARHKVENKELLGFLLYEMDDEAGFVRGVKEQADELFSQMNTSQVYFAKKSLRKILRILQKNIRFAASRQVEIELLLHFCDKLLQSGLPVATHRVLANMLDVQLRKIDKAVGMLHEDLQYDYRKSLNRILAAADMS